MNRNLNPDEFEQVSLFDAGERKRPGHRLDGPLLPGVTDAVRQKAKFFERPTGSIPKVADYVDPHEQDVAQWGDNPIYDPDAPYDLDTSASAMRYVGEEWVPTHEIRSIQSGVFEPSVKHLTEHSTGLGEGNATVLRGGGRHVLFDANHRVNAALRRGQLLTPADVYESDVKR